MAIPTPEANPRRLRINRPQRQAVLPGRAFAASISSAWRRRGAGTWAPARPHAAGGLIDQSTASRPQADRFKK
jgi:hypothetical protein